MLNTAGSRGTSAVGLRDTAARTVTVQLKVMVGIVKMNVKVVGGVLRMNMNVMGGLRLVRCSGDAGECRRKRLHRADSS